MIPAARSVISRRRFLAATSAAAAGSFLAACSGDTGSGSGSAPPAAVTQADVDRAMQTPTELTFWTWVPDIQKEVALFARKYPAIKVNIVNAGNGDAHYTKLRTALKAGSGAPDVAQMEFLHIPGFSLTRSLVDLRPYGAEARKDEFVDWTWDQVVGPNGEVWALPQDTGPMGMLYRKDILDAHGIAAPTTWDEFAQAARKLHAEDPNVYLTNLASSQNAAWMGLQWQAGIRPFEMTAPDAVKVAVNDPRSKEIGAFWAQLIAEGVVSTDPDFTDSWYQGLAQGKYASWLTAAWGPLFLSGSATSTSGLWRAAPLPQWDAGKPASGNWGGSTTAVISGTKNPIVAAKFAEFLNTDPESTKMLTSEPQFLFPPTKALLSDPAFTQEKPEFYGGQAVNQLFAEISGTVDVGFQWPPFMDQAATDWTETVGKSFADRSDVGAALDAWQQRIVDYAKDQGFTVATA
jgi:multiple sugar transport system substrate-binding protein